MDRESTSQASTDGVGEVKAAGTVCRPDAEGTRKSHLGGEKSIIVRKYYQPAIHNHIDSGLGTKRKKGTGKGQKQKNPENGMPVGIYYGSPPHTRAGSGREDPSFSIIMTVIVWSSDVCLETTHSRTRRPHASVVHAS